MEMFLTALGLSIAFWFRFRPSKDGETSKPKPKVRGVAFDDDRTMDIAQFRRERL